MDLIISKNTIQTINFQPEDIVTEITQNIKTILTTIKGTVPLDRDFGLSGKLLDKPLPAVKAKICSEIYEALNNYEQRVELINISFVENELDDADGILTPEVTVRIREGI